MAGPSLALVCDTVDTTGGAERYWATLLPQLRAAGSDVRVFARRVVAADAFGATAACFPWAAEYEEERTDVAVRLARTLREFAPDVVVTASVFDAAVLRAVRATGRIWISRLHDHRAFCPNGDRVFPQFHGICRQPMGTRCLGNALLHGCMHGPRPATLQAFARRRAVRDQLAQADLTIAPSVDLAATAIANGVDAARVRVVPPALPDEAYAKRTAPPPAMPVVLFAGRLTAVKGLQSLIRAVGRLQRRLPVQLMIAGSGPDEDRSRALAQRHGVAADWLGWLDPDALRAAIDRASLLALPSLWPEPFGLVGIEAQARGRPVVAYDVGGISEWIAGGGVAVPRGDEEALSEAIVDVLADWQRYARTARMRAERFRVGPHLERLLQLLGPSTATPPWTTSRSTSRHAAREREAPQSTS